MFVLKNFVGLLGNGGKLNIHMATSVPYRNVTKMIQSDFFLRSKNHSDGESKKRDNEKILETRKQENLVSGTSENQSESPGNLTHTR